jgi:predicted dehydrogenase
VDYRKLYSASSESGGVKFDLIHEFDYLISLFGFPLEAKIFESKVSHLEIDCPDSLAFVARYSNKLLELHLDYFGRVPQRYCELSSSGEVVKFDFLKQTEDRNASYMREIGYFLDFAQGKRENINSVLHANRLIGLIS